MSVYYKSIRQKVSKKYTEKQFLKLMKKNDVDCSSYLIGQEAKPCKEWDKMQMKKLNSKLTKSHKNRVPHVGWDSIVSKQQEQKDFAYFAHSYYYALPSDTDCETISSYYWGENLLPAIIKKDNVVGIQFHPEKSHNFGLKLLRELLT
jgi:imidazoleglycerol phosphate synthase glutamine amidotransferase subunit HisH